MASWRRMRRRPYSRREVPPPLVERCPLLPSLAGRKNESEYDKKINEMRLKREAEAARLERENAAKAAAAAAAAKAVVPEAPSSPDKERQVCTK